MRMMNDENVLQAFGKKQKNKGTLKKEIDCNLFTVAAVHIIGLPFGTNGDSMQNGAEMTIVTTFIYVAFTCSTGYLCRCKSIAPGLYSFDVAFQIVNAVALHFMHNVSVQRMWCEKQNKEHLCQQPPPPPPPPYPPPPTPHPHPTHKL